MISNLSYDKPSILSNHLAFDGPSFREDLSLIVFIDIIYPVIASPIKGIKIYPKHIPRLFINWFS